MNTPDTTERRGGIKGRSAPGERTGDSRLQPLNLDIRPKPLADETRRGSVALGGLPLSDIGLDDPACRGAEGGPKSGFLVCFLTESTNENGSRFVKNLAQKPRSMHKNRHNRIVNAVLKTDQRMRKAAPAGARFAQAAGGGRGFSRPEWDAGFPALFRTFTD
ncbi:hypothetical protein [Pantoea dispersa]|nr:hypothetical protein [Pantoea dispersa]